MTAPIESCHNGFRPGRLWSLWGMHAFDNAAILSLTKIITTTAVQRKKDKSVITDHTRGNWEKHLPSYERGLAHYGFTASIATLGKIRALLSDKNATYPGLVKLCEELNGRLHDEVKAGKFFCLDMREIDFFRHPTRNWEASITRFPEIASDVEEASKCLSLSRYPAAIYHSLQVAEVALIELGKFLKVKDPHSGWTAVAGALSKTLKKDWKDKSPFEKKNHAFLEQVHGTVEGLKNAWRNKISHASGRLILISKEFSPETAEEILIATRALVRRLADGLPKPKPKKGDVLLKALLS